MKYKVENRKGWYVLVDEDGCIYKDIDGNEVVYGKRSEAKLDCGNLNYPNTQWERYLKYLMLWTLDHKDENYEGMSPACYDEFCDNDDEPEYYEEQLDYAKIERDCKETIRHWKGE